MKKLDSRNKLLFFVGFILALNALSYVLLSKLGGVNHVALIWIFISWQVFNQTMFFLCRGVSWCILLPSIIKKNKQKYVVSATDTNTTWYAFNLANVIFCSFFMLRNNTYSTDLNMTYFFGSVALLFGTRAAACGKELLCFIDDFLVLTAGDRILMPNISHQETEGPLIACIGFLTIFVVFIFFDNIPYLSCQTLFVSFTSFISFITWLTHQCKNAFVRDWYAYNILKTEATSQAQTCLLLTNIERNVETIKKYSPWVMAIHIIFYLGTCVLLLKACYVILGPF